MGSKKPVHPNDDVNRSQSSNDVFPTAMHVAAVEQIAGRLIPAVRRAARRARREGARVRGHRQDRAHASSGRDAAHARPGVLRLRGACSTTRWRGIRGALPGLSELAIGGTAVGTGLNAPADFGERMAARLAALTGLPFTSAPNKFQALASHEAAVAASGALKTLACALMKIANDVRWLASGPRAGLGEIRIPENEPGSSIMPGKVNPTQSEAMTMVCAQVMGNDVAIGIGGASGQLRAERLQAAHRAQPAPVGAAPRRMRARSFREHCVEGIEPTRERIRAHVQQLADAGDRARAPHRLRQARRRSRSTRTTTGTTLREAALHLGHVTAEELRPASCARRTW